MVRRAPHLVTLSPGFLFHVLREALVCFGMEKRVFRRGHFSRDYLRPFSWLGRRIVGLGRSREEFGACSFGRKELFVVFLVCLGMYVCVLCITQKQYTRFSLSSIDDS